MLTFLIGAENARCATHDVTVGIVLPPNGRGSNWHSVKMVSDGSLHCVCEKILEWVGQGTGERII